MCISNLLSKRVGSEETSLQIGKTRKSQDQGRARVREAICNWRLHFFGEYNQIKSPRIVIVIVIVKNCLSFWRFVSCSCCCCCSPPLLTVASRSLLGTPLSPHHRILIFSCNCVLV